MRGHERDAEFRLGIGDQQHAVAARQAQIDQALRQLARLLAQLAIPNRRLQRSAGGEEIQAGVAAGGTTGQILSKTSATDYATAWTTLSIPASGVTAGTYGTQYKVPQITVGADGRVTAVAEVTVRARWG